MYFIYTIILFLFFPLFLHKVMVKQQLMFTFLCLPNFVFCSAIWSEKAFQNSTFSLMNQWLWPWNLSVSPENRIWIFIWPCRWLSGKDLPAVQETQVQSLGREDSLEKEMATHSSILAWRIPWREEPGRLQSMGRKESNMTERLHFHFLSLH